MTHSDLLIELASLNEHSERVRGLVQEHFPIGSHFIYCGGGSQITVQGYGSVGVDRIRGESAFGIHYYRVCDIQRVEVQG